MDLKDFIAESLKQVIDGVTEAQEYCAKKGAKIVPFVRASEFEAEAFVGGAIHRISFDVAITAKDTNGQDGKAGLRIPGIEFGGKLSAEQVNATISRVKFDIPVLLPRSDLV